MVFFWMVHKKKLFKRSSVKYWIFSEGPTWSDLSPMLLEKMKSRHKLLKNYTRHGKNCEISRPHNFWTFVKSNVPNVWNWDFWNLLGSKIEEGPLAPPVAKSLLVVYDLKIWCNFFCLTRALDITGIITG